MEWKQIQTAWLIWSHLKIYLLAVARYVNRVIIGKHCLNVCSDRHSTREKKCIFSWFLWCGCVCVCVSLFISLSLCGGHWYFRFAYFGYPCSRSVNLLQFETEPKTINKQAPIQWRWGKTTNIQSQKDDSQTMRGTNERNRERERLRACMQLDCICVFVYIYQTHVPNALPNYGKNATGG